MREVRPGSPWSAGRVIRRSRYAAYVESQAWFDRREQWRDEWVRQTGSEPRCAVCGDPWSLSNGNLHHRSYDRLGHERHTDLIAICRVHHTALHDLWDKSPSWRRLGRSQATAGIIAALRRQLKGTNDD